MIPPSTSKLSRIGPLGSKPASKALNRTHPRTSRPWTRASRTPRTARWESNCQLRGYSGLQIRSDRNVRYSVIKTRYVPPYPKCWGILPGCIEADFCKYLVSTVLIVQLSSSTTCTQWCAALTSKSQQKIVELTGVFLISSIS